MKKEIWKEVRPGVEVSSLGRVRKYLTGHLNGDGYLCISGGKRGRARTTIHTLVAEAFIGPRPAGKVVCHRNDDKSNNNVENLRYGTRKENYADAHRNGLVDPSCPVRITRLAKNAHLGGAWWKGRKRHGPRGKVKS